MTQKFFLKIDAESPDGEAVRCETKIKAECPREMIVSIIANLLRQDENLKKVFAEALLISMDNTEITETITDAEYQQRSGKNDDKLDF
jgi:hypothetical protein